MHLWLTWPREKKFSFPSKKNKLLWEILTTKEKSLLQKTEAQGQEILIAFLPYESLDRFPPCTFRDEVQGHSSITVCSIPWGDSQQAMAFTTGLRQLSSLLLWFFAILISCCGLMQDPFTTSVLLPPPDSTFPGLTGVFSCIDPGSNQEEKEGMYSLLRPGR